MNLIEQMNARRRFSELRDRYAAEAGEYFDDVRDAISGYPEDSVCDAIRNYCDASPLIYNHEITDWYAEHFDVVQEYFDEFGGIEGEGQTLLEFISSCEVRFRQDTIISSDDPFVAVAYDVFDLLSYNYEEYWADNRLIEEICDMIQLGIDEDWNFWDIKKKALSLVKEAIEFEEDPFSEG